MRLAAPLLLTSLLAAAEPAALPPEDMEALRGLLAQATEAFSRRDMDAIERVLAPRFAVAMADQRLATDRAGLQAGIERWCSGPAAPFASVTFQPVVDRHAEPLATGVVAVAGTSRDLYRFKAGSELTVDSRWTATVVRTPAGWRIAQLHLGIDPVDNPMMASLAGRVLWISGIAAAVALAVGLVAGWLLGRRRRA